MLLILLVIFSSKLLYKLFVMLLTSLVNAITLFNKLKSGVPPFAKLSFTVFNTLIALFIAPCTFANVSKISSNFPGLNLFIVFNIFINDSVLVLRELNFPKILSTICGAYSDPELIALINAFTFFETSFEISFIIFISFFITGAILFKLFFEVVKKLSKFEPKFCEFSNVLFINGIFFCISEINVFNL